jgi:hypothetical protein
MENANRKNLDEALVKDCASGVVAHLEPVVGHLQAHHPQYGACTRSHWISLLAQFVVVITPDFLTFYTAHRHVSWIFYYNPVQKLHVI